MKNKGGRPSEYYPEICEEIINYFSVDPYREIIERTIPTENGEIVVRKEVGNRFPTIERFCAEHGIVRNTLKTWAKTYPEFMTAFETAKELQRDILITNGLTGHYNSSFAKYLATNLTEYKDKQQIELTNGSLDDLTEAELLEKIELLKNK